MNRTGITVEVNVDYSVVPDFRLCGSKTDLIVLIDALRQTGANGILAGWESNNLLECLEDVLTTLKARNKGT